MSKPSNLKIPLHPIEVAEVLKRAGKRMGWSVLSFVGDGLAKCSQFFFGAGFLIFAWQIYKWLQTGHWPDLTLVYVIIPLSQGTDLEAWLFNPSSWYGLQKVVRFLISEVPLCGWMIVLGYISMPLEGID